jgi:hypothetical protein
MKISKIEHCVAK